MSDDPIIGPAGIDPEVAEQTYREIIEALWHRGVLHHKLHATQKQIYLAIRSHADVREYFLLCSRRLGKTFLLLCIAIEEALRRPNSRILFLAAWAKDAAEIATDTMGQILMDCPREKQPHYNGTFREYTFKNGSILRFKGVNGEHARYLRGGTYHLVVMDELGTMDDVKNVIDSVISPMLLTTKGKTLYAMTPADSPSHDSTAVYNRLADRGLASRFTILDAPHIPYEEKVLEFQKKGEKEEDIPKILAGEMDPKTTAVQREFFCWFVTDASKAVLPEFDESARKEIVRQWARPPFFDAYVSIDPGFEDRTGILFGFWDFRAGKLVIEDERLLHRATTGTIAKEIIDAEYALWGEKQPFLRVSDVDKRLHADLWEQHQMRCSPAQKQDSIGAINLVRNMIQQRTLVILPNCTSLIRQMKDAIWNYKATDFARAGETSPDGHYDLVAALKYLCRHVSQHRNPYPPGYIDSFRGAASNSLFRSPRRRFYGQQQKLGILGDTPLGRKIARITKRR